MSWFKRLFGGLGYEVYSMQNKVRAEAATGPHVSAVPPNEPPDPWLGLPWKAMTAYSDNLRNKDQPGEVASQIVARAATSQFPVLIAVSREFMCTAEDRAGRPMAWEFSMAVVWPDGLDDNDFLNSIVMPCLQGIRNASLGRQLQIMGKEDAFYRYKDYAEVAKAYAGSRYHICRCNFAVAWNSSSAAAVPHRALADSEVQQALETLRSAEDKVEVATRLLTSSSPKVRAAIASEVGTLPLNALGVWFELANRLGDVDEQVRVAAAKSFWKLKGVEYAIRSLRDEYEVPAKMSRQEALLGLMTLRKTALDPEEFRVLMHANWEDCPG